MSGQAKSQVAAAANLITTPPNLDNWVEREEEINDIQSWLNDPQVHTLGIQGLGGTGKSTIASYLYQHGNFADKYKFWADVSLKPDFTIFAEKVITKFGGKVSQPIDITQLINDLLDLLRQHRYLLVIDNLETLLIDPESNWQDEYYQQFFNRWLQQGTTSTLLITTREKPRSFQGLKKKNWYSLGGMKIAEGITLLTKLGIRGTEAELEEFVIDIGGHPLTIKLVAGYLREYCGSQLSQVAELGLKQFDLVYEEASGLHRNKQDARLSWIIQQHLSRLTPEQKNFLLDLSVYRPPFNREAASYIMAGRRQPQNFWNQLVLFRQWFKPKTTDKQLDIVKALQELCNRSLLTKTKDNRYLFPALVQEYLYQPEKQHLTTAHLQAIEYYQLHLQEEASWQVREDVSEYLEIIYHYCELGQYALANDVLNACFQFLKLRGYYSVLVELYEKLADRWQFNLKSEERYDYAWVLTNLGTVERYLGKVDRTIKFYNQSLEIFQEIGDRSGIASSLMGLGNAYDSQGDYPRAIDYYQQSLEIQQAIGNRSGEANSLMGLGNAYDAQGEHQRAIEYYQQSLEIQQEIGDRSGIANSLGNLGLAYYSLGEYPRAIEYYQQSLEIQQEIGDRSGIASSLGNLGIAYNSLGDYPQAIDYHQQCLEIQQQIGNRSGIASSLGNLGNAYYSQGDYPRAIEYHQQSLEIEQEIGDRSGIASSLNNLGNAYDAQGEHQRAIDYYQQSLEIKRDIGDRPGIAGSLNNLGLAYGSLGDYPRAIDYYQQSLEIQQDIGDRSGIADSFINLGSAYDAQGEHQRAIEYYQQSLEIEQDIGDRSGIASSLMGLGVAYYALGEHQRAIDYYQQSLEIQQDIGDHHGEAKAWFNLGITWEKLEEKSKAKAAYENARKLYQAMGLDRDVEDCNEAIQRLENDDQELD